MNLKKEIEKEKKQIAHQIESKLKAKYQLEKEKEISKIRKQEENRICIFFSI